MDGSGGAVDVDRGGGARCSRFADKRRLFREGYADGALTLFTRVTALDYVRTLRPVAMMAEANEIDWVVPAVGADAPAEAAAEHTPCPAMPAEMNECSNQRRWSHRHHHATWRARRGGASHVSARNWKQRGVSVPANINTFKDSAHLLRRSTFAIRG